MLLFPSVLYCYSFRERLKIFRRNIYNVINTLKMFFRVKVSPFRVRMSPLGKLVFDLNQLLFIFIRLQLPAIKIYLWTVTSAINYNSINR